MAGNSNSGRRSNRSSGMGEEGQRGKSKRGLASADEETRKRVASMGGKS